MHDVGVVRRIEGIGDLQRHVDQDVRRQRTPLQPIGQRLALEVLHDDEVDGLRRIR